MTDAFFVPDGDGWVATSHTRGPWSRTHQHGGPPAALIAHVVEAAVPGLSVARFTVDFLRPVPIDRVRVRIEPLRHGAKVQRWTGLLLHGETTVAHAVITLIRRDSVAVKPLSDEAPALPRPEASRPFQFPFFREADGYHTAMETRLARGEFGSGRAAAWMRQRVPLVPGAAPSPLERVLIAADSGSGVSAAIDHRRETAVNADLTVALSRPLEGEWVGLDSTSTYEPHGIGLADTRICDARGTIGRALQALVLEERGS
jgi:hypothetical protein